MSGQVLPDISAMIAAEVAKANARLAAKLEALEQENAKLKAVSKGLSIVWAKGHEGKAVVITWPGKRGRYIEVGEVKDLLGKGEEIEAWLKANG